MWWKCNPAISGVGRDSVCGLGLTELRWLRDVERSQGTQAPSLPEFERRSQGSIRGDAKKFALDRAQDFINRFGLPDEFMNVEEPESRFKEQIYNWFKNTVGRTRRKLEGRPRSQKKAAEKAASLANELGGWASSVPSNAPNTVLPYAHAESSAGSPVNSAQTLISPIQYGGLQPSSSSMSTALSTPTTSHATTTHAPGQASSHTGAHSSAHTNAHGPPPPHTPHTPHTAAHTSSHTAQHTSQHNPPPPPHSAQHNGPQQQQLSGSQQQQQLSGSQQQQSSHQPQHQAQTHNLSTLSLGITKATMRESFSQNLDASTIANMIASYIAANPSPTPLTPIVDALFDAISADAGGSLGGGLGGGGIGLGLGSGGRSEPHRYLRLFIDASHYFPSSIVHAGVSGPMAGPRALQMQIRKYATWIPTAPPRPSTSYSASSPTHPTNAASSSSAALPSLTSLTSLTSLSPLGALQRGGPSTSHAPHPNHPNQHTHTHAHSLSDEMQRIAMDRQRRKDHIQWARIHAAALELSMLSMGRVGEGDNSGYTYAMGRAFSEMMARDAVWEEDEVEWVAGIVVLRAVIRTALRGDRRQRDEYDELLRTYERRWKEIKDEARQQAVTEVLLSAKEDLAQLDGSLS
ncbi:hypothetical protein D9619_007916 [Psilocybe cf. subviscida]|uniref:Uncharacterized protein n=1 Tax=Psilocybe cf. subviscida TaxID=2480587 RepID=A0A8H5AV56_9AGAR|nr:hypothetical protein D9619_007916 [Psilocybe cf. subviscida]